MCLYPQYIRNPKYKINAKNGGNVPPVRDVRTLKIPITCGRCSECREQKASGWMTRIIEEVRHDDQGTFVTFTFTDESILELKQWVLEKKNAYAEGYDLENEIAKRAVELWRERWRKETGKSPKHWLITELGHKNTERIHIHGIVWSQENKRVRDERLQRLWQYGRNNYYGRYMNERTGAYITKYMNKTDLMHPNYTPVILTSPGIGAEYTRTDRAELHRFRGRDTRNYYIHRNGFKGTLPTYYKHKIYTDSEREMLWIYSMDKNIAWVKGDKIENINTDLGRDIYQASLDYHRAHDMMLGYAGRKRSEQEQRYENEKRNILMRKRECKLKNVNYEYIPNTQRKSDTSENRLYYDSIVRSERETTKRHHDLENELHESRTREHRKRFEGTSYIARICAEATAESDSGECPF